jgi:hypothetical protein
MSNWIDCGTITRASGAGAAIGACGAVRGTTDIPLPPHPASATTQTNEAKRRMPHAAAAAARTPARGARHGR